MRAPRPMSVVKRCGSCNEPIAKTAKEEGGIILLGVVVAFPGVLAVICRKCSEQTTFTSPIVAPKRAAILPDRLAAQR
jgi:hypothetical protein